MQPPAVTRIRPSRWFRHALSARDMASMLGSRAQALESARDQRVGFCRVRCRQAEIFRDMIEAGAFGAGAAWIERLEIARTHRYLQALEDWDRGETTLMPAPWRAIFSLLRQEQIEPPLSLELSAIVHDVYDLPLALARIGVGPGSGHGNVAAFAMLGEVYAATIESAERKAFGRAGRGRSVQGAGAALHVRAQAMRERWGAAWLDAQELFDATDERTRTTVFERIENATLCAIRASMRAALAELHD